MASWKDKSWVEISSDERLLAQLVEATRQSLPKIEPVRERTNGWVIDSVFGKPKQITPEEPNVSVNDHGIRISQAGHVATLSIDKGKIFAHRYNAVLGTATEYVIDRDGNAKQDRMLARPGQTIGDRVLMSETKTLAERAAIIMESSGLGVSRRLGPEPK